MYLTHVHREPRAIHFSFASALRYPTVCQLMYRDGSPVTAMLIPVHQWNRTFTFNRLNKRTYYRVRCGSDPAATLSSQSFLLSSTTYWMPPPPARSWLPWGVGHAGCGGCGGGSGVRSACEEGDVAMDVGVDS